MGARRQSTPIASCLFESMVGGPTVGVTSVHISSPGTHLVRVAALLVVQQLHHVARQKPAVGVAHHAGLLAPADG